MVRISAAICSAKETQTPCNGDPIWPAVWKLFEQRYGMKKNQINNKNNAKPGKKYQFINISTTINIYMCEISTSRTQMQTVYLRAFIEQSLFSFGIVLTLTHSILSDKNPVHPILDRCFLWDITGACLRYPQDAAYKMVRITPYISEEK